MRRDRSIPARREAARLSLILDAAPTGMLVADAAGRIVLANARLEAMFGHKRGALSGKSLNVLIPKGFRAGHTAKVRAYSASPAPRLLGHGRDLLGLRSDGTSFPIEIGLNPVRGGRRGLTLATVIDITRRVKARETVSVLERESAQWELLANFSHELKTPIATLRAAAETLLGREMDQRHGSRFLKTIGLQTERLTKLVDNLLQLTALDETSLAPRRVRFSLSKMVSDCVLDLSTQLKDKSISLWVRIDGGVSITGDHDGLRQAAENLIDNAIQYNRPGGRVSVALRREKDRVVLSVQDTGIGIAKSELAGLFQRFHRTLRGKRLRPSGTGLGLAIVKRVAELHGGRIGVSSRAGRGTRFQLSLPLR